ncbi:MAG: chromosome segregation protein SMC [Pirellulales bacterium]
MLKALELVGFKSFADRTRFEFPDGITVVVGPNGSGKSNIVDAIKWVLGAQSAKSLRGADMADVIFKGSAAGGRKPSNSAEATLVFDNSKQQLPVDTPEVHITRRVYRSGESEYLINSAPCRLKDIKDLFRGTGVGVDAYSLIEQGKVDRMLQASPKDRRAIFEEAAGISRFKAKKVEAERRLSRVDQNLLRLGDIVEEVKTRYETLQNQAEKARRYREMNQRLSLLRTQLGLADADAIRSQQAQLEKQLQSLIENQSQLSSQYDAAKQNYIQVELRLQDLAQKAQQAQTRQQDLRQKIASHEANQQNDRVRRTELSEEKDLLHQRLRTLQQRVGLSNDEVQRRQSELAELEEEHRQQSLVLHSLEHDLSASIDRWKACQQRVELHRETYMRLLQDSSLQSSKVASDKNQLAQIEATLMARTNQLQTLQEELEKENAESSATQLRIDELERVAQEKQQLFQSGQSKLQEIRQVLQEHQEECLSIQGRIQGLTERLNVLEELEQQREGIGRGAQQLIGMKQSQANSAFSSVCGLVADLIDIDVHLAPLVDVALGQSADAVVLSDGQVIDLLRDGNLQLEGRVSLIRLDRLPARRAGEKIQLDGLRGVIGRADRLVQCQEPYQPLVRSLLGTTWLVDTLATALDLSHLRGAGLRFVTASCERIDSDGTLTIGALKSALGLVARKSELHAAREEIAHYQARLIESNRDAEETMEQLRSAEARVRFLDEDARSAQQEVTKLYLVRDGLKARIQEHESQCQQLSAECEELQQSRQVAVRDIQASSELASALERDSILAKDRADEATQELRQCESEKSEQTHLITAQRITMAKVEQRIENHRVVLDQLTKDHSERKYAVSDVQQQLQGIAERFREIELRILDASSKLADLYLELESNDHQQREWALSTRGIQTELHDAQKRVDQLQRQMDKSRDRQTQLDHEKASLESNLHQLHQRFHEDYQLDLNDPQIIESTPAMENRAAAEQEAAKLRQEIAAVGSVNMESLRELDELQGRYETLAGHYRDLTEARDQLLKVIAKINQDSRRLFLDTLEVIRTNFQLLYRKSFGGGHADIILEEGEDVLECGVEIVATPPGKTSLSNSLLSGGEKALTAVALIMAIFQFRPSPFCVLDEVDAPFDEANIGRFVTVLKEFLDWTKFIVVTHSKKTMTAANTLYGVTMQESGVSTQVSVRFEDVGENGEILNTDSDAPTHPRIHRAA